MTVRAAVFLLLITTFAAALSSAGAVSYHQKVVAAVGTHTLDQIEAGVNAQRAAGFPRYDPEFVFVVDPSKQRIHVISRKKGRLAVTLRCGTGKRGLGFGDAQTPPGFFTMGGVRIAKNADTSIQTGDTKKGVSGVYAELLYPPSFPDPRLRGKVPNGVVIHSYNPAASKMLYERRAKRLIGKVPCTTGCPVPDIDEVKKLVPYLKSGAGKFDPDANPNAALRTLIAQGKVKQYAGNRLGAAIYIMGGR